MSSTSLAVGGKQGGNGMRKGLVLLLAGLSAGLAAAGPREPIAVRASRIDGAVPARAPLARVAPLVIEEGTAAPLAAIEPVDLEGLAPASMLDGIHPPSPVIEAVQRIQAALRPVDPTGVPAYGRLTPSGGVLPDPLLTPINLWAQGPLGRLRAQALDARERGARTRFEALRERFWKQYRIGARRRALHGRGP